jgi:hypothetical protein
VHADSRRRIVELDEDNNVLSQTVEVDEPPAGPDFQVTRVTKVGQYSHIELGDSPEFDLTVQNNGYIPGAGNQAFAGMRIRALSDEGHEQVATYDHDTFEKNVRLSFPQPFLNERYEIQVTGGPPRNPLLITFAVDHPDAVAESNENNNSVQKEYGVRQVHSIEDPWPDVVVEEIFLNPPEPDAYDNVYIGVRCRNIGTGLIGEHCVHVTSSVMGTGRQYEFSQCSGTDLDPGEAKEFVIGQVAWVPRPGTNTITAQADWHRMYREIDEGNNSRSLNVEVAEPSTGADLQIVRVRKVGRYSHIELGGSPEFDVTVRNNVQAISPDTQVPAFRGVGLKALSDEGHLKTTSYDHDAYEKTVRLSFSQPFLNERREMQVAGGPSPNPLVMTFGVRQVHSIDDPWPDVVIEEIFLDPPEPSAFDNVHIGVRYRNTGTAAIGVHCIHVSSSRMGTGRIYSYDMCSGTDLAAGEEKDFVLTQQYWVPAPGSNIIRAIADFYGNHPESNEENNSATRTIVTPEP